MVNYISSMFPDTTLSLTQRKATLLYTAGSRCVYSRIGGKCIAMYGDPPPNIQGGRLVIIADISMLTILFGNNPKTGAHVVL